MIEQSFIDSGFSFTISKILPYFITLLIGAILVFLLRGKHFFKGNKILTVILKVIIFAVPFGLYFLYAPIYEGDFSNGGEKIKRTELNKELSQDKLYVITIPGCPYCKDALGTMSVLKKRNPGLAIEYVVCSEDSISMKFYSEANDGSVTIRLAENPEEMSKIAGHSFPAYVLSEPGKSYTRWTNNLFGVKALDQIETLVK